MKTEITLCFDFGNSRKKLAVFSNKKIIAERILYTDTSGEIETLLQEFKPQKSILSSVINHNPGIEETLKEKTHFHKLSVATKLNFTAPVGKPETIGADRLAIAAAAVHFFLKKQFGYWPWELHYLQFYKPAARVFRRRNFAGYANAF